MKIIAHDDQLPKVEFDNENDVIRKSSMVSAKSAAVLQTKAR